MNNFILYFLTLTWGLNLSAKLQNPYSDQTSLFELNAVAIEDLEDRFENFSSPSKPFAVFLSVNNPERGYLRVCGNKIYFDLTQAMYKAKGLYWLGRKGTSNLYIHEKDIETVCAASSHGRNIG